MLAIGMALLACASCQLPDVAPFHAGTVELEQSFRTVGESTSAEIREAYLANDLTGVGLDGLPAHPANRFENEWRPRIEMMASLTEYSRSLNNIAASAKNSKQNVSATLDAAGKLAEQFGGTRGVHLFSRVKNPAKAADPGQVQ